MHPFKNALVITLLNHLVKLAGLLLALLAVVGLATNMTLHTAISYGLAVLVALLPTGLIIETLVTKQKQQKPFHLGQLLRCILTDSASELWLIAFSLVVALTFHVPPALTAIQLLALGLITQSFPLLALEQDKAPRKKYRLEEHVFNRHAVGEFIWFGLAAAVLSYAGYLLFYLQHGLSSAYVDPTSQLSAQATTVALLTLALCQSANLLLTRAHQHTKFFTDHLTNNKKLLQAFGIALFLLLNVIYNPLLQKLLGTGPLGFIDWLSAIVLALLYTLARLSQRHTRHHTRHAVLNLHREIHG